VQSFSLKEICLFLDIDGTLLDLASRPQDVYVPPSLVGDLQRVSDCLDGALALVSGRSIESIDHLFRPLRLRAAGVHGAELRLAKEGPVETGRNVQLPVEFRQRLVNIARELPDAIAEDKKSSVALHYRAMPERRDELLAAIRNEVAREGDPTLTILPGHFVFEVKRKGHNKGTAITAFMREPIFSRRKPVVFGDDVTDEAAFKAALRLGGAAFSVGRDVPGVTGIVSEPEDLRRWLKGLQPARDKKIARSWVTDFVELAASSS
jgi:trehalose 6-phosphate phosphatase